MSSSRRSLPPLHAHLRNPERVALFPARTDFSRTYVIKFAKSSAEPDARPFAGTASGRITLRMAGPLGRSEVSWETY